MPKRDEIHMAGVRKQILDAAHAVFDRKGVAETSISDIAREAGISVGSIYVHFQSKDGVLRALIEQVDPNLTPFETCRTADELLDHVELLLEAQDQPGNAGQAAGTALEVAIFTRRNADMQTIIVRNFEALRSAVLNAVQRIAGTPEAEAIGEGLLSLLVSAQSQMLVGVPTHTDAKRETARWLISKLRQEHGASIK